MAVPGVCRAARNVVECRRGAWRACTEGARDEFFVCGNGEAGEDRVRERCAELCQNLDPLTAVAVAHAGGRGGRNGGIEVQGGHQMLVLEESAGVGVHQAARAGVQRRHSNEINENANGFNKKSSAEISQSKFTINGFT